MKMILIPMLALALVACDEAETETQLEGELITESDAAKPLIALSNDQEAALLGNIQLAYDACQKATEKAADAGYNVRFSDRENMMMVISGCSEPAKIEAWKVIEAPSRGPVTD